MAVKYVVVFFAGAVASLAFAPYYVLPLVFISFPVLLFLVASEPSWRRAGQMGWVFGLGYFLVGLHWIGNAFLVDAEAFGWAEYPAVIMLSAGLALYPGIALAFTRRVWDWFGAAAKPVPDIRGVIAFAIIWTGAEWLRGHMFTGFPWNLAGYVWGIFDVMLQSAAIFGIYGLTLITVLLAALPVTLLYRPFNGPYVIRPIALFLAGHLGMFGYGTWVLQGASDEVVPDVRLRIVQANIRQADKWDPERREDHLIRHLEMSGLPSKEPITDIIWPETAIAYFVGSEPSRRHLIANTLNVREGHVITGAPRLERSQTSPLPKLWNSVHAIGQDGILLATYDKFHLVPFGEYLPFREILTSIGLNKLAVGDVDFTPGPGPVTMTLEGLPPFSPLICYEVIFPGKVTDDSGRAEWILNVTNDAWFGDSTGPYQHLVAVRARAVEEGLPIIRAAGTGISAIVDAYGRVLDSVPLNHSGILDGALPVRREYNTIYARWGDWSYLFLSAILVLILPRRRGPAEK